MMKDFILKSNTQRSFYIKKPGCDYLFVSPRMSTFERNDGFCKQYMKNNKKVAKTYKTKIVLF